MVFNEEIKPFLVLIMLFNEKKLWFLNRAGFYNKNQCNHGKYTDHNKAMS